MDTEVSAAPKSGPRGNGTAPVVAAGGVAVLCLLGLVVGGSGVVASALEPAAPQAAIHASPVSGKDAKNKTDGTGTSTAGPTPPPERGSAPTSARPADTVYYIRSGDTLAKISLATGVSVDRLAQYNAIQQTNLIYADSALRVPYVMIPGQDSPAVPQK